MEAIWAAVKVHETAASPIVGAERSTSSCQSLSPILFLDLNQSSRNLVKRLVPGNPLVFPFASTASSFQWVINPSRMVEEKEINIASAA